jgi:hypothetical protein
MTEFNDMYCTSTHMVDISFLLSCSTLMNISSSAEHVTLIRLHGSMTIESLKLALEWHQGDIGDEIFALRERLNMNDQGNFYHEDNRPTMTRRLRLPSLSPRTRKTAT